MSLVGKSAFITGSNSGIGLGVAKVLAARGANVALNSFTDRPRILAPGEQVSRSNTVLSERG